MSTTVSVEKSWEVSDETTMRLAAMRKKLAAKAKVVLARYHNNPVAWAEDCIDWPGEGLTDYQKEVLMSVVTHKRVAQRGPHGLGKSTTSAILLLWFALTRDAQGIDWKCITTAGGWAQLEIFLWPEIHKWAKHLRWDRLGRQPFGRHELLSLHLNLRHGSATAVASNNPGRIEGAHADSILYIFDESKIITNATFDAAEGAFSGAGANTGELEAYALASSTPGEPIGRFYDIHSHKKGFEDWHTRHVTIEEAMAAGRVDRDWVEQRKVQWGENSQIFANRVLGEFHESDEDVIIPLSWIEAAQTRWVESASKDDFIRPPMTSLGIDVADMGEDSTVFAPIHDYRVEHLHVNHKRDTNWIVDHALDMTEDEDGVAIVVDADGVGVGVYNNLNNVDGVRAQAFKAGEKTEKKDRTGVFSFANKKAAAWWQLREELDPMNGPELELPPDDDLAADLSAPRYDNRQDKGIIRVEAKEEVKKRLGRSTDRADGVVMGRFKERKRKKRRIMHAGPDRGDEEAAA